MISSNVMLIIVGILITFTAVMMVISPETFTKYRNQRIPEKMLKSPKMIPVLRAWGSMCAVVGVILIIVGIVHG